MEAQNAETTTLADYYPLPNKAFTLDGSEYCPKDDYWKLKTRQIVDFRHLARASQRFRREAKRVMIALLSKSNALTCIAVYRQFANLYRSILPTESEKLDAIEEDHLQAWVATGSNIRYVPQLRIFTNAAREIGAYLISTKAQEILDTVQDIKNGRVLYEDVRTWNPTYGAYRPAEDQELKKALDDGFNTGRISLREYFICRLYRGFGVRPEQLAQLKVGDFKFADETTTLRIPILKQRGEGTRTRFSPWRPVSQGLAHVTTLYIKECVQTFVIDKENIADAPLVLGAHQRNFRTTKCLSHHASRDICQKTFQATWQKLNVISPLTGEPIHVTPRRERHTFGTQLAMNGARAEEIAINMGHSSTTSCEAYVDASIDHFQRMETLVGEAFIPIADRFLGKVIGSKEQFKDVEFALFDSNINPVGSCAIGGCDAVDAGVAPIACYTCRKFNAWEDGPHGSILDFLLDEQRALKERGHSDVAEAKTETIVAICDLIEAIHQLKRS